jgi:hypothetical protein
LVAHTAGAPSCWDDRQGPRRCGQGRRSEKGGAVTSPSTAIGPTRWRRSPPHQSKTGLSVDAIATFGHALRIAQSLRYKNVAADVLITIAAGLPQ